MPSQVSHHVSDILEYPSLYIKGEIPSSPQLRHTIYTHCPPTQ